tara:strand:- start:1007 stop:4129 length:3123 start_codon:yes stop_codon:yes gene_type:complete
MALKVGLNDRTMFRPLGDLTQQGGLNEIDLARNFIQRSNQTGQGIEGFNPIDIESTIQKLMAEGVPRSEAEQLAARVINTSSGAGGGIAQIRPDPLTVASLTPPMRTPARRTPRLAELPVESRTEGEIAVDDEAEVFKGEEEAYRGLLDSRTEGEILARLSEGEAFDDEAEVFKGEEEAFNSILSAADAATPAKINQTPRTTKEDAEKSKQKAATDARTILGAAKNTDTYEEMLKLLGGDIDPKKYNKQAKELLGIDEDESDVPDWAAPMFLFGLNLMRGPVSSKVEGRTGVSGLLSDISAAGEKGFAFFAKERARKAKQRSDIATLSLKLGQLSSDRRKLAFEQLRERNKEALNLDEKASKAYDRLFKNVVGLTKNPTEKAKLGIKFANTYRLMSNRLGTDKMMNPKVQNLVLGFTLAGSSIDPPFKIENLNIGGLKTQFNPADIKKAMSEYNKINPNDKISSITAFVGKIIAKAPGTENYQGLIATEIPEGTLSSKTVNIEDENGNKITQERMINEKVRNQWLTNNPAPPANASEKEKTAYAKKLANAQSTWDILVKEYKTGSPKFTRESVTNSDGKKINFFFNQTAFNNLQKSNPGLNLQDVLLNAEKYPNIISGKIEDYANLQPSITDIPVFEDGKKRTFVIDKNAFALALKRKEIKAGATTEELVELGIGRFIGEGVPVKPNQKIQVLKIGSNGVVKTTSVEAQDAGQVIAAFNSKEDARNFRQAGISLKNLHTTAYQIQGIISKDGRITTSSLTDLGGSLISAGGIVKSIYKTIATAGSAAKSRAAMNNSVNTTKATKDLLSKAFSDKVWTDELVKGKEQRGAVKSMFINLAFALASTREGGKLTDNDVKNALETLGWSGDEWTLTPGEVLTRLKTAVRTASDNYIINALSRMSVKEREKYLDTQDIDENDLVEAMLRQTARAIKGPMQDRFREKQAMGKKFNLRFDRQPDLSPSDQAPTVPLKRSTIPYGGGYVELTAPPSSKAKAIIDLLQRNSISRNANAIRAFINDQKPATQELIRGVLPELLDKGFLEN